MSELPLSMVPCPGLAEVPVLGDSYHRPTAADSFVISIIMGYNSLSTLTHAKKITLPLRPSKSNRNKKNRRLLNCSIGTQRWGRHSSGVRRFCLGPGAVRRSQPTLIQAAHYLQQNVLSGGFSRGVIAAEDVISSTDFCSVILRTLDIFLRHFAWVNNRLINIYQRGTKLIDTDWNSGRPGRSWGETKKRLRRAVRTRTRKKRSQSWASANQLPPYQPHDYRNKINPRH